jgi:Protein of unknown function (DUF3800)
MPKILYCYVDESGQHTQGRLFVVTAVFAGTDRDELLNICENIEERSGKGRTKWHKSDYKQRLAYIKQILNNPVFLRRLNYAVYRETRDYTGATAATIAKTFRAASPPENYKAIVIIDGLPHSQEEPLGVTLRHLGVRIKHVRGLRDETDALIRLADAACGLLKAAFEEQPAMVEIFERGKQDGFLVDVSEE